MPIAMAQQFIHANHPIPIEVIRLLDVTDSSLGPFRGLRRESTAPVTGNFIQHATTREER